MDEHTHLRSNWCIVRLSVCCFERYTGPFSLYANTRPHHNWAPTKTVWLSNAYGFETLTERFPYQVSSISEVYTKSEIVSEQCWGPVCQRPSGVARTHWRLAWMWFCVNRMHIAGHLALILALWRRFLIVCVEILTPLAFCKSFWSAVAVTKLWFCPWITIKRFSRLVLNLSRPPPCLYLTFPCVRNRSHILPTVLWDNPRTPSTCRWECPAWSLPVPLFITSVLSYS